MPASAFVAAWRAMVARQLAAYNAAWDEILASPRAIGSHPAHARIEAARVRLTALIALSEAA